MTDDRTVSASNALAHETALDAVVWRLQHSCEQQHHNICCVWHRAARPNLIADVVQDLALFRRLSIALTSCRMAHRKDPR